jgi:hypothetical protein
MGKSKVTLALGIVMLVVSAVNKLGLDTPRALIVVWLLCPRSDTSRRI